MPARAQLSGSSTRSSGSSRHAGLAVQAGGRSDIGRVRPNNEDRLLANLDLDLYAVADGVGGAVAGEVAAELAVNVVEEMVAAAVHADSQLDPKTTLVAALSQANRRIWNAGLADPRRYGMGTTFVGVLVRDRRLCLAHAGDSRAYRLRGDDLRLLTRDHNLANDHADRHADRFGAEGTSLEAQPGHALTRFLGAGSRLTAEAREIDAEPGDVLLLCSDGISSVVPPEEIAAVLGEDAPAHELADRLVARALDAGGPDNATCVVMSFARRAA